MDGIGALRQDSYASRVMKTMPTLMLTADRLIPLDRKACPQVQNVLHRKAFQLLKDIYNRIAWPSVFCLLKTIKWRIDTSDLSEDGTLIPPDNQTS